MPLANIPPPTLNGLESKLIRLFELSAQKILAIEKTWDSANGAPVFTVDGKYQSRGWTEWTQGFQYGSALLQFDATGEKEFLELGRDKTTRFMAPHLTHFGVHDHGFNNISTYGNLWRLMREGKITANEQEQNFYELALKVSGAVQAARWTNAAEHDGFIYSFNGPQSLFIDTIRSLRSLAVAHQLGHFLSSEHDEKISLFHRLLQHARTTAKFSIYYGTGRDIYDVPGRTVHECIFNVRDGRYRCPSSQQGYSPFSTWTRGLAWAICGFAEQLEFAQTIPNSDFPPDCSRNEFLALLQKASLATADYYLQICCSDGIPIWDTGAPNLPRLGDFTNKPADPFNNYEPIDSSAAVIAAQGLYRLGKSEVPNAARYQDAALLILNTLLEEPYLSTCDDHQGLLLHSLYHRPNGWDHIRPGQHIPNGESSMWGDYHLRELALLAWKDFRNEPYLTFSKPA
jgi:hypothetical protein